MLSRSSPGSGSSRDPALDGLRGVAILLVFLFHYGGGLRSTSVVVRALGYVTEAGWTGVHLFFALSGFFITGLLWRDRQGSDKLRNFFARRALRILPLYFAALLLAVIAAALRGASPLQLRPVLVYAAFLQNMPPLVSSALHYPGPLPLHHLWSLAVEEQFYLVWPFLLLAVPSRRAALRLCLGVFAVCCAFRAVVFAPNLTHLAAVAHWSAFPLTRGGSLALGGALTLASGRVKAHRGLVWLAILASAAVALAVGARCGTLVLTYPSQFIVTLPAIDVLAVGLVALALLPGVWSTLLGTEPLRFLGRISYGFYVLHILLEPVFDAMGRQVAHRSSGSFYQLVRLLVAFPVTTLLAWISFRFLESPFLRLKRIFPHTPDPALLPEPTAAVLLQPATNRIQGG